MWLMMDAQGCSSPTCHLSWGRVGDQATVHSFSPVSRVPGGLSGHSSKVKVPSVS